MSFLDKRPVFKNRKIEKSFKNAEFYFTSYSSDCPICLDFYNNPQILPCGHCYCLLCISKSCEFTKNCPICSEFFWIYKPVKFYFKEQIGESILLKRISVSEIKNNKKENFFEFPYSFEYFLSDSDQVGDIQASGQIGNDIQTGGDTESIKSFVNSDNSFYQSNDGQLYFLDNKIAKSLKTHPTYIFIPIKESYECFIDYKEFPNLLHIPSGTLITIITKL